MIQLYRGIFFGEVSSTILVMIKTLDILEGSLVTELILILGLDHSWPLSSKCPDCLKQV